jgi:hypothetical protein
MLTIRFALLSTVLVAGSIACSAAPEERAASSEQRLDVTPDGGAAACTHGICATGQALVATCDPCTTQLCAQDPYCCTTSWDATCVGEVGSICGQSCAAPPGREDAGPSTCVHPVCATGPALGNTCDACATKLCAQDPYCCAVSWDATCVGEVTSICGQTCN